MAIAQCPECREEVTVPPASEQAVVQCPLCDAEYELAVITESLPPALKVLSDPQDDDESELQMAPVVQETESHAAFAFDEEAAPTRPLSERSESRRSSGSSPVKTIIQVVLGGALALPLAQLVLWHLPDPPRDPLDLGKKIHKTEALEFLRGIVPPLEKLENPQAKSAAKQTEGIDASNRETAQKDEHPPISNKLPQGNRFNVGPMDEIQLGNGNDALEPFLPTVEPGNSQNPTIDEIAAQAKPAPPAPLSPTEYIRGSFLFQTVVIDQMFEQAQDSLKQWDDLEEDASENLRRVESKELFLSLGTLASGITYQDPEMSESFDGVSRAYAFFEELAGRQEIMKLMNEQFEIVLNTRLSAQEGVLFTAQSVGEEKTINGYQRLTVKVGGTDLIVPLLYSPEIAKPIQEDVSSLVLGSLIRRPRRDVRSYLGTEEFVVIFGAVVPLASSSE